MSVARFPTMAKFDNVGRTVRGTVYVDRAAGVIGARPLRRRRTFELPLSTVADMICRAVVLAELRARQRERMHQRRGRR